MLRNEGFRLMGAAFKVDKQIGYGMAEEVYQRCLEIELRLRNIEFVSKPELQITYKSNVLQTKYRPDLFVLNAIVVELKAVSGILPEHEAQPFNYMRIVRQPVGYRVNSGRKNQLEWKRFTLFDLHPSGQTRHDAPHL